MAEFLTGQARDSVRMAWALVAAGSALLWLCSRRLGAGTALILALAFHGLDIVIRFIETEGLLGNLRPAA